MKRYVGIIFIPLYIKYLYKTNSSNSEVDIETIVDAKFHEKEFVEWLRKEYKERLTAESYPQLSTNKNFQKYLTFYNKIKNKKVEIEKKKIILELIESDRLKPVTKYEYDVDIVDAYFKIKTIVDKMPPDIKFENKEQYLESMLHPVRIYCKKYNLPFAKKLEARNATIVKNTDDDFIYHLARTLIAFDVNKIEALLSHQLSKWKQKTEFPKIVEHGVYRYVLNNSPFDNSKRLEMIMRWVNFQKGYIPTKIERVDINPELLEKLNSIEQKFKIGNNQKKEIPYFKVKIIRTKIPYRSLLKGLRDELFIDKSTNEAQLKILFLGGGTADIKWIGTPDEFKFFINALKLMLHKIPPDIWKVALLHFIVWNKKEEIITRVQLKNTHNKIPKDRMRLLTSIVDLLS